MNISTVSQQLASYKLYIPKTIQGRQITNKETKLPHYYLGVV